MKDNQNRNLEAAKRHLELEAKNHSAGIAQMIQKQAETEYPEWTEVEGTKVLRIGTQDFVAAPNRSKFDIINLSTREFICQVTKSEVCNWLMRAAS